MRGKKALQELSEIFKTLPRIRGVNGGDSILGKLHYRIGSGRDLKRCGNSVAVADRLCASPITIPSIDISRGHLHSVATSRVDECSLLLGVQPRCSTQIAGNIFLTQFLLFRSLLGREPVSNIAPNQPRNRNSNDCGTERKHRENRSTSQFRCLRPS